MGERVRSGRWNGPTPLAIGPSLREMQASPLQLQVLQVGKAGRHKSGVGIPTGSRRRGV